MNHPINSGDVSGLFVVDGGNDSNMMGNFRFFSFPFHPSYFRYVGRGSSMTAHMGMLSKVGNR